MVKSSSALLASVLVLAVIGTASAQQPVANMDSCIRGAVKSGKVTITNACDKSISVTNVRQTADGGFEKRVMHSVLKPGQSMTDVGFGTACPEGLVSDVAAPEEMNSSQGKGAYRVTVQEESFSLTGS